MENNGRSQKQRPGAVLQAARALMWWATLVVAVLAVPTFGFIVIPKPPFR